MPTNPRLLHLISELDVGGSELSLARLLPHLQTNFDNHVACEMGHGAVGAQLAEKGIPVHYLNVSSRFTPQAMTSVTRLLRELRPAAVIGTLIHADLVGRVTARRERRPFISNQRSSLQHRQYLRYLDFATQGLVTRYVVQTESAKDQLHRRGWVPDQKITVIPNVVELPQLTQPRNATRQALGLSDQTLVITCVSNLRPGKGHATLLKAFSQLPLPRSSSEVGSAVSCQLLLVGDGPLRSELEQQVHHLGLTDRVHFLGLRSDVPDILAASDMFVLPSEAEGMSNALLEAMASGLPCLAADIPANRDVITAETNGLLFTPRDPAHLAKQLKKMIASADVRSTFGQAATRDVAAGHNPVSVAKLWHHLFQSVLTT